MIYKTGYGGEGDSLALSGMPFVKTKGKFKKMTACYYLAFPICRLGSQQASNCSVFLVCLLWVDEFCVHRVLDINYSCMRVS